MLSSQPHVLGPSSWGLALDLRSAPLLRESGPRNNRHGIQLSSLLKEDSSSSPVFPRSAEGRFCGLRAVWLAGPECDTCGSESASRPISAWVRRPLMGPWPPDPRLLLTSLSALRPCCLKRRAVFRTYSPSPSFRLATFTGQINF